MHLSLHKKGIEMDSIVEVIRKADSAYYGEGIPMENIAEAESKLHLKFAKDYTEYLNAFGIAAVNGHELTGLDSDDRVNVVTVTLQNRDKAVQDLGKYYVIEESNIDGLVVWQDQSGKVFVFTDDGNLFPLCNSLVEYINR